MSIKKENAKDYYDTIQKLLDRHKIDDGQVE
jgi:hypothetical protein